MEPIDRSTKPRNWTRAKLNREMKRLGLRQAKLVPLTGRAQSVVSDVMGGKVKSTPVATVVAAALGRLPHEIWPRLYAAPRSEDLPPSEAPTTEATAPPDLGASAPPTTLAS